SFNNLTSLPSESGGSTGMIAIALSADEMNADVVVVKAHDQSGSEWCDQAWEIFTASRYLDDHAYPTTSGRSIDVTATGEVGVDWSNIGSPTTAVNLSGTTVKAVTDGVSLIDGAITAAKIAASAITAAKIATDAIGADQLAAAAIDKIWDEVVESTYTARQFIRGFAATLFGKVTGGGSTAPRFRDVADSKNRVSATTDTSGNRSSVTLDLD